MFGSTKPKKETAKGKKSEVLQLSLLDELSNLCNSELKTDIGLEKAKKRTKEIFSEDKQFLDLTTSFQTYVAKNGDKPPYFKTGASWLGMSTNQEENKKASDARGNYEKLKETNSNNADLYLLKALIELWETYQANLANKSGTTKTQFEKVFQAYRIPTKKEDYDKLMGFLNRLNEDRGVELYNGVSASAVSHDATAAPSRRPSQSS